MDTIIEDETFTEQSEQQPIKRPCCKCKKDSPYQCPQCKWFYCSLKCYQTHNLSCTEEFYKKNVIEHLKSKKVSPEEAKKMQKVLEKNKDKNELEFLSDHKHKRFEELLTLLQEGELTFDKLTPEETKEFSRFIKDGSNLQGMIKEWMPWWENEEYVYNLDIQEVNEQLPEFEDKKEGKLYQYRYDIKERYEKVPFIESLIQKEPSPEVNYHIVQYIFCFAYLCREYNGDLKNCHDTIVPTLISLAKCLTERISVPNVSVSLDNSLENIIQIDGTDAMPFIEVVLRDLANIYEKKFFLYEVFFRSYDVLHRYHEALDNVVAKEGGSEQGKKHKLEGKKIAGIKQKLIFYMAYLKRKTQEDLDVIKKEIKSYIREKVKNDALNREMEKIVRNYDPGVVFTHKTANL